jgi:hypothetical protein
MASVRMKTLSGVKHALIFITCISAACSKNDHIKVVCEVSEVTSSSESSENETRSIKKTIRVWFEPREIIIGNKNILHQSEAHGNWSEIKKSTWVYQVDSDPAIFERSTVEEINNKTESHDRKVEVDSNAISVTDHHRQVFRTSNAEEAVFIKYYRARLDRVSGKFEEETVNYYNTNKNTARIRTEAQGFCKKAEQKF